MKITQKIMQLLIFHWVNKLIVAQNDIRIDRLLGNSAYSFISPKFRREIFPNPIISGYLAYKTIAIQELEQSNHEKK